MTIDPNRRRLLASAGAVAVCGFGPARAFAADAFPNHTVRMIVPFPAGGPTDIVARPIAQLLGDAFGQTIYVDNRGGAGGSIGAEFVARATPDGYTVLMGTVGTAAINATLYKKLSYDPVADFAPIGTVAAAPVAVVAHPNAPFRTLAELVERAKAAPDTITYGTAGNGTPGHLAGALFCSTAGIKLRHVPYRGSAPAIGDLLGGQVPLMFDPLQSVLTNITGGKLNALAVTSRQRAEVIPKVPTVAESGFKDFEMTAWWAVFAPAKLPADVAEKLRSLLQRIVESKDFASKVVPLGVQPLWRPLPEFQKAEIAKWGDAVRSSGITIE